jgi:recombination protein RecT
MNQLAVIEHQLQPLRPMFDQLLRPTGVPAERIIRSVLISCERTPRLLECTPLSVIQAATTGAVLGLEADGHTGQGFLVPFRQKGTLKAQWLTGYKGFNTLAARVGLTVNGEVVREGDEFDFELGSAGYVRHKPALGGGQNRRIIGAWATASAPDRAPIVVVMDIDEILAIKGRSQAAKRDGGDEAFSPWSDPAVGFPAMSGKTAKRRLARSLPLSVYLAAARIDEAHEEQGHHAYLHPEKGIVIDGETAAPPAPTQGPSVEALEPRRFVIKRNRDETSCSTIEEWRGRMVTAIQSIGELANVHRFRELNAPVMQEYRDRHREHVAAVEAAFAARLRGAQQNRPGEGNHQPQEKGGSPLAVSPSATPPRGVPEIVPSKVRGGFDWTDYAARVLAEFRAVAPDRRQAFRAAQARYLSLLRQADKQASTDLAMSMSEVERGDRA